MFSIRREPTLVIQAVSAVLTIVVSFGFNGLSAEQAGLIIAVLSAGLGAINALKTRPVTPAAITGLLTAGVALVSAYGLDLSQELVGSMSAAVPVLLMLLVRGQVTPTDDPRPADIVVG